MQQSVAKVSGSNGGFRPEEMHRREFQKLASVALDHHTDSLNSLQTRVNKQGEFIADLSVRVDDVAKDHATALTEIREDFYCRSLFGRIRWLLTGK